ncbi:MAG: hypothetical protein KDK24_17585, partial [Pseudooceanicola sp.]|nr:hypothetical protein [Pseudooceanicola sp.]
MTIIKNHPQPEARMMIVGSWALTLLCGLTAFLNGVSVVIALAAGGALALGGSLMLRGSPAFARIGAAQALVGQGIVLNATLTGHAWQIDMHMMYFALLATVVVLNDIPAILAAAAMVALHHLTLTFIMPGLVFPSTDLASNIPRTVVHAAILMVETGALVAAVATRHRLDAGIRAQNAELESARAQANGDRQRAEALAARSDEAARSADLARTEAEAAL